MPAGPHRQQATLQGRMAYEIYRQSRQAGDSGAGLARGWPLPERARVSAQITRMFESAIVGELEPEQAVARAAMVISGITGLPERGARRRG